MNDRNALPLEPGMFTACSSVWDPVTQTYKKATSTQLGKCCIDNCNEPAAFCRDYCNTFKSAEQLNQCLESCDQYKNTCLGTCGASLPHIGATSNNYIRCAEKFGCLGTDRFPNQDCVSKNKNSIFQCCRDTCIPMTDLDCQSHCEFLQTISLNPPDEEGKSGNLHSIVKTHTDYTSKYVIIAMILSMAVLILVIVLKSK